MFGTILLIVFSSLFVIAFGTYLYLNYKDRKDSGPMPWEFGYDKAREEREALEKLRKQQLEPKKEVKVSGLDEYIR